MAATGRLTVVLRILKQTNTMLIKAEKQNDWNVKRPQYIRATIVQF